MAEMESTGLTRLVGLDNWSVPVQKNLNFHASAVLQYENYAHQRHSHMLVELTCWPFDFMPRNMPNSKFDKIINNIKVSIKTSS